MPQENKQVDVSSTTIKEAAIQQVEWLKKVIEQLEEFKNRVSKGTILLEEGCFDKSLNLPEIDVLRTNELRLSIDYTEVK
ncbi:TPA: hypothetical protein QFK82_002340 [Enterococcus faecium]|uniref:hypothetical protein n=1 Tax=Enterococcus faecium TaxID=1352 RepID=UPI00187E97F6|nr:hypothetical protein [Enterococcus faecium]EME7095330.1 hypothetical protein [Enterococcus faecium]EMF0310997.1 hypothetical protein [Enterococcus faecium]MBE8865259.1 hypothetical protein [Enterococcus faecium]MDQ8322096.1 hypothetical protein [Enterococcus faecium]MDQ8481109.1 hypothetical protein [Enterococcus faecium]